MAQLNSPVQPAGAAPPSPITASHDSFGQVYDQFDDIRYKLGIEESALRFRIECARANPQLYQWSPRELMARPDPETTGAGTHEIELDDTWFQRDGRDQRVLTGRDLRYWLIHHLHTNGHTDHSVAGLVGAIGDAGFTLVGRASKTVSDALHTETDRGRVRRTGWGRYRITGPLPSTSAWRIRTRCERLRANLARCITHARARLTAVWQHTLKRSYLVLPKHQSSGLQTLRLLVFNPRVASPTERSRNNTPNSHTSPPTDAQIAARARRKIP